MKQKKRTRRSLVPALVTLLIIVAIVLVMAVFYNKFGSAGSRMKASSYFGVTSDQEAAIVVNGTRLKEKAYRTGDKIYIDYDTVFSYINSGFYWDSTESVLSLTLPQETLTFQPENGGSDDSEDVIMHNGSPWISTECIRKNSDLELKTYQDPERVVIRNVWTGFKTAKVKRNSVIRYKGGPRSQILTDAKKGLTLAVGERFDNWTEVSDEQGYTGYIRNGDIRLSENDGISHTTDSRFVEKKFQESGKVNLAWQAMETKAANGNLSGLLKNTSGLTVISPAWFKLQDENGTLRSFADKGYVDTAHQAGLKVWGMFAAFDTDAIDAGTVFRNQKARLQIINQLLKAAADTGMDGINLDLEAIKEDSTPQFLQFVRELAIAAHKQKLSVSVDSYVPAYTAYLKRREQAKWADYIIIMGYDEHTKGSQEAGSVASISFVKKGIEDSLKEVPKNQLINAIPFYTRGWTEEFGSERPKLVTLGMDQADEWAAKHGIKPEFDKSAGQSAGTAEDDKARYSIWLEDERAVTEKMKLIKKYDLAGVAEWRLGFERSDVWKIISGYLG